MSTIAAPPQSQLSTALAHDRLGVAGVVFFVMSAAAPLTVVAGVATTGLAVTGLTGISIAFLAIAVVLAIFAVGYVAMARHIANAGAFYAYIAQGLGRPLGVGAAWLALLAYNCFQIAAYGGFGAIASPLFKNWFNLDIQWWILALICWAITAALGVRDVAVNGKVLATLLVVEIVLVVVFSVSDLFAPTFRPSSAPLDLGSLVGAGSGALLAMAVTGFVGFEQSVVFSEESRDPRRTVSRATYIAVSLIAVLYGFASWAMISAAGDDVVERAGNEGPDLFFNLASEQLGYFAAHIGHAVFLTSLIAAMISFHNIIARYTFSLGREGVLPRMFGRTVPGTGAPRNGSLGQSALSLVIILLYAVAGWDPLVQMFFWGGTAGGIGVLLLITATSIAVVGYFTRHPKGEDRWHRIGAPVLGAALLVVMSYLALSNIATLFGVEPGSLPAGMVPLAFGMIAFAGILWALYLRSSQPQVYAGIGLGARAAAGDGGGGFVANLDLVIKRGSLPQSSDTTTDVSGPARNVGVGVGDGNYDRATIVDNSFERRADRSIRHLIARRRSNGDGTKAVHSSHPNPQRRRHWRRKAFLDGFFSSFSFGSPVRPGRVEDADLLRRAIQNVASVTRAVGGKR